MSEESGANGACDLGIKRNIVVAVRFVIPDLLGSPNLQFLFKPLHDAFILGDATRDDELFLHAQTIEQLHDPVSHG